MVQQSYLQVQLGQSPLIIWSNWLSYIPIFCHYLQCSLLYFIGMNVFCTAWGVCSGSSETAWAGRWIWWESSFPAAEHLSAGWAWVHKTTAPEKRLIRRKIIATGWTMSDMSRWSFPVSMAGSCRLKPARRILRFFSWILGGASLSAVQIFFSSGLWIFCEFVRFVVFNGCPNVGLLVRETKYFDW